MLKEYIQSRLDRLNELDLRVNPEHDLFGAGIDELELMQKEIKSIHAQAIQEVFQQFDDNGSSCADCHAQVSFGVELSEGICESFELLCRSRLLEAAEELDNG